MSAQSVEPMALQAASTTASARLRLQVGDQVADVTLPASLRPERAV